MDHSIVRLSSKLLRDVVARRYLTKTSQKPRPDIKHYRLWAIPGDLVLRKDILARQFTMKWHPGLNVGIDEDRTIYALCDGVMIVTEDQFDPDWTHPIVQKAYIVNEKRRAPEMKRYIHVLPKKITPEFKLVDAV